MRCFNSTDFQSVRFCLAAQSVNFFEQRGVGFLRVLRLPAFMPQVLQEIFDENLHDRRITKMAHC